jgi:NCS1 family nucleobase:cation symporter-1
VFHYTIDILGALIEPLLGILIRDYYLVKKQKITTDDLYGLEPEASYCYQNGDNKQAIYALIPAAIIPILCVRLPQLQVLANCSWFIGMLLGLFIYTTISLKLHWMALSNMRFMSINNSD